MKRIAARSLFAITVICVLTVTSSGTQMAGASTNLPVPGQYYQIIAKNNGECLTTRSWTYAEQIVTRACQGINTPHQWWRFDLLDGNGHYRVVNKYNDMCMDVAYGSQEDWANVVQAGCWGGANQYWRMSDNIPDGFSELNPAHSEKCLDISFGWAIQYHCNGGSNQRFTTH